MRNPGLTVGVAAAIPVLGAGVAVEVLTNRVVRVRQAPPYRHDVLAVGPDAVLLRRDHATELPGTYGLAWPDGHAVVGPVLHADGETVLRRLERVQHGIPRPGPCALDHIEVGDPASALGLEFSDVTTDSDVGGLPGWWLRGDRRECWVLLAHGYGGSLVSSLSFLPPVVRTGVNALVVSYRNDPGAPASADRRYHLGLDEWRDLDAGLAFAAAHGARQILLYGWSMGGGIVLTTLARSARRGFVRGLILDAPVLDWAGVIRHVGRRVPRPLVGLVLARLAGKIGGPLAELDQLSRAGALEVPLLCFHGARDELVPVGDSRRLASLAPGLVDLVVDEAAGHVGCFNVDPSGYEERVATFIDRILPRTGDAPAAGV